MYNVAMRYYRAPDGDILAYGGESPPHGRRKRICRSYASRDMWETGRACGDRRLMGPTHGVEVHETPIAWYGRDGYYCTVCVQTDNLNSAIAYVTREFTPDRRWVHTIRKWRAIWPYGDQQFVDAFPVGEWRHIAAVAVAGRRWRSLV